MVQIDDLQQDENQDRDARKVSWGHWFTYVNAIVAVVLGFGYLLPGLGSYGANELAFLVIYGIGQFALVSFILFLMLVFPLAFVIRPCWLFRLYAAAVATLSMTLLVLDLIFFHKYNIHLSRFTFELALSDAKSLLSVPHTHLIPSVILVFVLEVVVAQWLWSRRTRAITRLVARSSAALMLVSFFVGQFIYIWADAYNYQLITQHRSLYPLSYPTTAKGFLQRYGIVDVEQVQQASLQANQQAAGLNIDPIPLATEIADAERFNVLLVVVQGWRADALRATVTPHLYATAQHSAHFSEHFSVGNNAKDSLFATLYGLHGSYLNTALDATMHSPLLDAFDRLGYQLSSYSMGDTVGDALRPEVLHPNLHHHSNPAGISASTSDSELVTDFSRWLKQRSLSEPYFAQLYLSSAKGFAIPTGFEPPFQPDLEGFPLFGNVEEYYQTQIVNRYYNALNYIDSLWVELESQLQNDPQWQNTVVIITSDHGMQLNDNDLGIWGYNANYSPFQTHVPLIYVVPGAEQGIDVTYTTSHYDLLPTLLSRFVPPQTDWHNYGEGLPLSTATGRDLLLLGNERHFALREPDRISELRRNKDAVIYDLNYNELKHSQLRAKPMRKALEAMGRFYQRNSN